MGKDDAERHNILAAAAKTFQESKKVSLSCKDLGDDMMSISARKDLLLKWISSHRR